MRFISFFFPALALLGALIAATIAAPSVSQAKPDYTKKERRDCTFCHLGGWSSGQYTEAGEYYKEHHSMKGYKPSEKK